MSAVTRAAAPGRKPGAATDRDPHDAHRLSRRGVLRSEWRKLRSLRSTVLLALAATGAVPFFGLLNAVDLAGDWNAASVAERGALDPMGSLLGGWFLAQVMVAVLGVLAVTSEYRAGSMTATLTVVPRRPWLLAAKLLVPATATFALFLPATVLTVVVGSALLPTELGPAVGDPGVVRATLGVPIAMAAVCAIGTATGFVLRSPAGSIGALVTVLLVVPGLVAGWSKDIYQWLPGGAIDGVLARDPASGELPLLDWPPAAALLAADLGALVVVAALTVLRRDA